MRIHPDNEGSTEATPPELADAPPADQNFVVVENASDGRFELHHGGRVVSIANYTIAGDIVVVPHVGTLPEHRGLGYAGRLMDGLLDQLRASGRSIKPVCPFAAAHIRENRRWHDLLAN
jgi:predicted GNAT family acetyltransferase